MESSLEKKFKGISREDSSFPVLRQPKWTYKAEQAKKLFINKNLYITAY